MVGLVRVTDFNDEKVAENEIFAQNFEEIKFNPERIEEYAKNQIAWEKSKIALGVKKFLSDKLVEFEKIQKFFIETNNFHIIPALSLTNYN